MEINLIANESSTLDIVFGCLCTDSLKIERYDIIGAFASCNSAIITTASVYFKNSSVF